MSSVPAMEPPTSTAHKTDRCFMCPSPHQRLSNNVDKVINAFPFSKRHRELNLQPAAGDPSIADIARLPPFERMADRLSVNIAGCEASRDIPDQVQVEAAKQHARHVAATAVDRHDPPMLGHERDCRWLIEAVRRHV